MAIDPVQALVATRQYARAHALALRLVVRYMRFRPAAGVVRAKLAGAASGGLTVHFLLGCVHILQQRRRREKCEQQPDYDGYELRGGSCSGIGLHEDGCSRAGHVWARGRRGCARMRRWQGCDKDGVMAEWAMEMGTLRCSVMNGSYCI